MFGCYVCGHDQSSLNDGKCHGCNSRFTFQYKNECPLCKFALQTKCNCKNKEEKNMMNPIDQIKEELIQKYGLNAEDIKLELTVNNAPKGSAEKIAKDYAKYPSLVYVPEGQKYAHATGNSFNFVTVREIGYTYQREEAETNV